MARTARIADITPKAGAWPNLLDATLPGAPNVQVARVVASQGDREERIAIVFPQPAHPVDRAAALSAVGAQLSDFSLAYVVSSQPGLMHLWIDDASPSEVVFLAAAAAAKLQHSWGWDESASISVSVGDHTFCFQVQHSGERTHEVLEVTAA